MARGKKPTVSQANLLRAHKMDPKEWLFLREETTATDGGKLSRNAPKSRSMVMIHRVSGEKRCITV